MEADPGVNPLATGQETGLQIDLEHERLEAQVVAAQEGDEAAMVEVCKALGQIVNRAAFMSASDPWQREELAAGATERVVKSLGKYSRFRTVHRPNGTEEVVEGSILAWTNRVARNYMISAARKESRILKDTGDPEEVFGNMPTTTSIETEAEMHSGWQRVKQVFDQVGMPGQFQGPLYLHLRGYTAKEIAEQLSIPVGTAQTRIHRGVKRIKESYKITKDTPYFDLFADVPDRVS